MATTEYELSKRRNYPHWSACSPDIILLIFKQLDYQTLLTCMSVCKLWRDVVDYMGQNNGLWSKLAQLGMYNKGTSFKQKSSLNWRDMYFNSLLWNNMNTAKFKLDKSFKIQNLRSVHVYKDNIIVVGDSVVRYYNVNTCEETKILEKSCLDFQESDHMNVELTAERNLFVNLKHNQNSQHSFPCYIFKLTDDHCYVIDKRHVLWLIKCCDKKKEKLSLTRSYGSNGSICDINIYENYIFILTQNGNVFQGDETGMRFKNVCNLGTSKFYRNPVLTMFQMFSVVYSVARQNGSELHSSVKVGVESEVLMECPGLTCATPHGEILFLGYEDGRILICIPKEVFNDKNPQLQFNIKDIAGNTSLEDPAIKAIDVYEARGAHYLYIVTELAIFKVLLTHDNII